MLQCVLAVRVAVCFAVRVAVYVAVLPCALQYPLI